jgi:GNAT superfamily N-acetyltransferase
MILDRSTLDLAQASVQIYLGRPPFNPVVGARLGWFLEHVFGGDDKPDVFVTATARGEYETVSRNEFVWAEWDGQIVSGAWTISPVDDARIGSIGEVFTAEAYRGRGLARAVCQRLLQSFDERGGQCMFLATSNPTAELLYRQLGFETLRGQLMRRTQTNFEDVWFRPSPVTMRPLIWGDLPRLIALYAVDTSWVSLCMMQGFLSARWMLFTRANSFMKHTWQQTRQGLWLGLFNAEGALVGSCPAVPMGSEHQPLGGQIDVFVHPSCSDHTPTLLRHTAQAAQAKGWRWLIAWVASGDIEKRRFLAEAGFELQTHIPEGIAVGDQVQPLELWRWSL